MATDLSNFDKKRADVHFVSFLFYYCCIGMNIFMKIYCLPMTEHEIQQFKSCGTDQKLVFMLIHHNLIFPDAPQEEVLEDLLPPVVVQDSNYTFSESEIEPENSTNDGDLPEILLGPRNVTAYLGNVKSCHKIEC